jgi:flagellin
LTFNINGGTINVTLSTLDPRAGSSIRNSTFLNYLTGKSFSVTGGASSYSVQLKDANNNLIDTQTLTNNQSAINFSNGIAINLSSNTLSASQIQTAITANSNSITITAASSQTTSTTTTTTTNGDAPQTIQVGASTSDTTSVKGLNIQTNSSGTVNEMTTVGSTVATLVGYDATTTNTSWNSSFNNLSTSIDNAVDYISAQRGAIGAQMNALGYRSQNLIAISANIEAANSTITSTDYAQAIANITKQQIMQQASTAILAQANQSGKIILDLCQSSAMRLMI